MLRWNGQKPIMKSAISFLLFALVITGVACKKKQISHPINGDYLIVGHSGGYAPAETPVVYYMINNGELRKDPSKTMSTVPKDIKGFDFSVLLPQASYQAVADLPSSIPSELLQHNNAAIGNYSIPDVASLDVRTSIQGVSYRWSLSDDQSTSSPAVQQFFNRLIAIK